MLWRCWHDSCLSGRRALFQRLSSSANLRRGAGADMLQKRDERIATHLSSLQRQYRELQRKYRENREHFTTLRQCYYLIVCAWCKRRIRWKPKEDAIPGDTSHGICLSCFADMVGKITAMKQASDSEAASYDRQGHLSGFSSSAHIDERQALTHTGACTESPPCICHSLPYSTASAEACYALTSCCFARVDWRGTR